MNDPALLNPLNNPLFGDILLRAGLVYALGFLLILALHGFRFGDLWESNVGKRYLSWLVIGPLYLLFVLLGGYAALLFLAVVLFLGIREVQRIGRMPGIYAVTLGALAILSIIVASFYPKQFYMLPIMYFTVLTTIGIRVNDGKESFKHTSLALFVAIWLIFSLSHFVLLGHFNNALDASLGLESTKSLLLLIGFAVPLSDVFAYVIGRGFHKLGFLDEYKIASNLSKHKTYIGVLGNITGALIGVSIMLFALQIYLPWYHWLIMGVLIGIFDVIGDITESMVKRAYDVKDSGTLIPGHGGILDRIDSTLRVILVVYYYLLIVL